MLQDQILSICTSDNTLSQCKPVGKSPSQSKHSSSQDNTRAILNIQHDKERYEIKRWMDPNHSKERTTRGRTEHSRMHDGRITRQTDFRAMSKGNVTNTTLQTRGKVANQTTVFEPELEVQQTEGLIKTQVKFGNAKEFRDYCKEIQGNNFKSIMNLKAAHLSSSLNKPSMAAKPRVHRVGSQTEHLSSHQSNCGVRVVNQPAILSELELGGSSSGVTSVMNYKF